jgi:dienelactone hydrolase
LRVFLRYDQRLFGKISRLIFSLIAEFYSTASGKPITSAAVVGFMPFGDALRFNPHFHALILEGGFGPDGQFFHLPIHDTARLAQLLRQRTVGLFLKLGLITESFAETLLRWRHSGFSVNNSVLLEDHDCGNTGDHAGLSTFGRDDWISMGYTAAGGEFLNSWGGLNVLCSLPEADVERVGATGLSGGGAHCFFLGIADERVKAVASTCGVVNLKYTLKNRHYNSNCDCMFWYNVYRKDTSEYGALIAPRPLLFAHARGDYLFTPPENRDLHANISRIYQLYGCPGNCRLFEFDGPHSYQPASVKAINDWFDLHLAGRKMKEGTLGPMVLSEKQCTIWNGDFPVPDRLDILPELLTPPRSFPLPDTLEELSSVKRRVLKDLEERVFNYVVSSTEKLSMEQVHEWVLDPAKPYPVMRKYRGSMGGMELWITQHMPGPDVKDILLYVCDRDEDENLALSNLQVNGGKLGIITLEPRAGGLNAYDSAWDVSLMKAGLYVGVTPVTLWMKDIREVLAWLASRGELANRNVYLYGARDAGIAALYCTLMDDSLKGVIVKDMIRSHRLGGHILNILKVIDIEEALGLLAPRVIGLDTREWEYVFWSARVYQRLGIWDRFVHTHSMAHTLGRIFGGGEG